MGKIKILNLGLIVGLLITLTFIGGCAPAEAPEGEGSIWPLIIFMMLIFGVFYFFRIRGQRQKMKEHQEMEHELKRGDKIVTIGGIYGQIESISEDSAVLKIESGTTIRVAKGSIAGKQVS